MSGNVIVPLVTPPNMRSFHSLIDHVLAGGIKHLLLFGTMGDGSKIGIDAKKKMIVELMPTINNRANLYIVLFGPSLEEMVQLANYCHDLGFKGAYIPIVYARDERVLSKLLKETQINYYLYNTLSEPSLEIEESLFNHDRIVGLKDSTGNIDFVRGLVAKYKRGNFKIYYGREYRIGEALSLDIDGIVSASGNLNPELLLRVWRKEPGAIEAFYKLKKEIELSCPGNYIQGLKNLLAHRGVIDIQ